MSERDRPVLPDPISEAPRVDPPAGVAVGVGEAPAGGLGHRLASQWAALRDERERRLTPQVPPVPRVDARPTPAETVPRGVEIAVAWSWRLLIMAAALGLLLWLVAQLSVVVLPVAIALLLAALLVPVVDALRRVGVPRGPASLLVVAGMIAAIAALLTLAGQQIADGAGDLAAQAAGGIQEIRDWLRDGPLNASDSQINAYLQQAQDALQRNSDGAQILQRTSEVTTAVSHILAGFFIVLFSTYFFLAQGERIWSWTVRLTPRAARAQVDSSGRVAWISLVQFVRATVIVAAVDALGIAIGAAVLGVPFVLAIGVVVFLGAFVPLIGATVAGAAAVLVALVAQGPVTALIMLGVIVAVQQLEAHVLQPFLMGRWVSVHPLGVIIAIATGVLVAGVAGALVAVPLVAAVNAVCVHLAAYSDAGDGHDAEERLADDYAERNDSVALAGRRLLEADDEAEGRVPPLDGPAGAPEPA
ncbi:AI-2E family transporter [Nocardioides sp. TRM66260-LWL]|uniref:AI-2E family transporter n=1 Tax=Nocardioides sp. TRM66260-LWL TaxID=2874478 RepID=UPI001CC49EF2|nr:AI-2E family transporter [Nocardioides sp. TRM66260-LWL]MBZ5736146.1 AI-2E family transporter [Nocardioides sp. TRM66260-LWL]